MNIVTHLKKKGVERRFGQVEDGGWMLGVEATLLHLLFLLLPTLPVKGWRPTILPNLATRVFGDIPIFQGVGRCYWGVHICLRILRWQKGNRTSGSFDLLNILAARFYHLSGWIWNIINYEVFTQFFSPSICVTRESNSNKLVKCGRNTWHCTNIDVWNSLTQVFSHVLPSLWARSVWSQE